MRHLDFFTRLRRLGLLSISALLVGGAILIFVGCNGATGPKRHYDRTPIFNDSQRPFRYGYTLDIPAWLAIIGVAFGLISHGFNEAYVHMFDSWCSRQAKGTSGLDYARYLNSQPRAPLVYGIRGFPGWSTIKYLLTALTIAASVGYKFGIVEVGVERMSSLKPGEFSLNAPEFKAAHRGIFSPWMTDSPDYLGELFEHDGVRGQGPPETIFMTSLATCPELFGEGMNGIIWSREITMVASREDELNSRPSTQNVSDWMQTETTNLEWFEDGSSVPAIVDYRIVDPGKVEIQWTKGDEDQDEDEPPERHLMYTMRFAVAEVQREMKNGECPGLIAKVDILSTDDEPLDTTGGGESWLHHTTHWVDAMLRDNGTNVERGVSMIVRSVMMGWATDHPRLGRVPNGEEPFGPETPTASYLWDRKRTGGQVEYPYFWMYRRVGSGVTGCYYVAAYVFLAVGCIALVTAAIRIWIGPPTLTSWTAQHVYLVSTGAITMDNKLDTLATGYTAATQELGRVRLKGDN